VVFLDVDTVWAPSRNRPPKGTGWRPGCWRAPSATARSLYAAPPARRYTATPPEPPRSGPPLRPAVQTGSRRLHISIGRTARGDSASISIISATHGIGGRLFGPLPCSGG
jgi:hypothetical protein